MFSLDKFTNGTPIAVIRGENSGLDGEIVYMKNLNREEDTDSPIKKKRCQRSWRSKRGGKVKFKDYDEYSPRGRSKDEDGYAGLKDGYAGLKDGYAGLKDGYAGLKDESGQDELAIDSGKFELLPNTIDRQRHCIYIAGRSGSGKSTWCRNYIKNYLKMKKGNPVYIFSALESDDAFDDLKVNRIILDEDIVHNPIDIAELRDSLSIFDDIDTIKDPKIKQAVYDLQDQLLECGRHQNADILSVSHRVTDGRRTRNLLNEANYIVIFPCRGSNIVTYYLNKYSGLDKKNIRRIFNSPSRYTCIQVGYPGFILNEKEIYLPE